MKVYLCGAINGCSDEEVTGWRKEAASKLTPHEALDPTWWDYRGKEVGNESLIVERDKALIRDSHVLLVNAERASWGTAMEVFYAHDIGKQAYAFVGRARPSPWLTHHTRYVFPHMADAITAILAEGR